MFPCPRMWPQALQEERHFVSIGTCLDTLSWHSMCEHVVLESSKHLVVLLQGEGLLVQGRCSDRKS